MSLEDFSKEQLIEILTEVCNQNRQLKDDNKYYETHLMKYLKDVKNKKTIRCHVKNLSKQPLDTVHYSNYEPFYGFTLTLDRMKWNPVIYTQYELYGVIFEAILMTRHKLKYCYYSFELQQDQVPHAHGMVILKYGEDIDDYRKLLKGYLTDNTMNRYAIKMERNIKTNWHDYINKDEGYTKYFYLWKEDNTTLPELQEVKPHITNKERLQCWKRLPNDIIDKIFI